MKWPLDGNTTYFYDCCVVVVVVVVVVLFVITILGRVCKIENELFTGNQIVVYMYVCNKNKKKLIFLIWNFGNNENFVIFLLLLLLL